LYIYLVTISSILLNAGDYHTTKSKNKKSQSCAEVEFSFQMDLSKPGQTTVLSSGLSPSQQLSSSDNQLPNFTSANWVVTQNRPSNTDLASVTVKPFNAPSRILMPWESVAVQSPNTNSPRPEKVPNTPNNPASSKRLPQMEVSPKPTATKGTSRASNKRPIQQIEVSPKAQPAAAVESVRSKLRESLAAALSPSTGEKTPVDVQQQNGEEKANLKKEEGQDDCESMVDELLQGNGLSWAENSQYTPDGNMFKAPHEDEKSLATKIEAELFVFFGGVNKKYKEKGRSLLFNLKDPNNPELRVRVLSGNIKPKKLCLMSTEELASKQLTEWRQAKAEEMAQAIVLPDADVDIRKRVKKTHKGEFVVIEEEKDTSWAPLEAEIKAGATVGASTGRVEQSVKDAKVEDEGPDLMLEIMGDGFVDVDVPPVTLDEFMKDLDSEPPFSDLDISNANEAAAQGPAPAQTKPSVEKEEKSGACSDLKVEQVPSEETSGNIKQESTGVVATLDAMDKKENIDASVDGSVVKSDPVANKLDVPSGKLIGEHGEALWEGVVQLNVSSLASVVAFYKR
jgi:Transcription factor S-II (TFIIS), central domain